MKQRDLYNVAIYLRLSRDDEDIDGEKEESNSISSQRDLIRSFIRKQPDMEIYDIYVDDGFSCMAISVSMWNSIFRMPFQR